MNPSEEKLPAGWSIDRRSYVEMFNRRDQKPLMHTIVVIPYQEECDKKFVSFWSRICENAGGNVRVVDNPGLYFFKLLPKSEKIFNFNIFINRRMFFFFLQKLVLSKEQWF